MYEFAISQSIRFRYLLIGLAVAIAAALVLPAIAGAATLTVNDDTTGPGPAGANCAAPAHNTIQAAINDAALNDAAPDTVLVCAGTYSGAADGDALVTANRTGLDLIGARAGQDARTRASGPESLISDPDGGIRATVNDITIDGFDIRDAQQTYYAGIYLNSGTANHRVINNIVRDNGEGLAMANGSAGQTVIRNNFFDANNEVFGNGISADLGQTENVLIDRNRFRDQANAGVIFQSTSPSHGFNSNVQIVGNQFDNTNPDDVFNENRIVLLSTDNALIGGNTFTNNANNAIQLLGANQGVDVIGNTVSGAGFSAIRIRACSASDCGVDWNPNTNVRILGNNLTGTRDSSGDAAAINVADAGYAGVLQAHFNRIAGNDRGIQLDDTGELVDAENNWWGCNAGPGLPGCDTIFGAGAANVDATPRLLLGITADPTSVTVGKSSAITADLLRNSSGATPSSNQFPDGVPVSFGATFGSAVPSGVTDAGAADSTFTAGPLAGAGTVTAQLDNQQVSTPITVLPPSVAQQQSLDSSGRCAHHKTGNSGNNFLAGTDEGDRIKGKGGDDSLRGKGGDDCLSGGTENDRLNGGSGEDLLKGGAGDDVIYAKDGEFDKVRCGFGDDTARVDPQDTVSACEHVG